MKEDFWFQDPIYPNHAGRRLDNIKNNTIQPFPESVSPECRSLIRSLLSPSPKDRPRLKAVLENLWLKTNAEAHAHLINKPERITSCLKRRVRLQTRSKDISSQSKDKKGKRRQRKRGIFARWIASFKAKFRRH